MDEKCDHNTGPNPHSTTRLETLFSAHGVLLEINGVLVQYISDGLVEVGSWGIVGNYTPIEEAEELLFS